MEEALRSLLMGAPGVAAIVGTRVDWGLRPQGDALPSMTLIRASSVPQMNLAGPSGWSRDRVQIEHWGRTYLVARDLADIIGGEQAGLLTGYRGDVMGTRLRTFIVGRLSDADTDSKGPVHRTLLDVMVWHRPI